MVEITNIIPLIYSAVGIFLIVLLYIAYCVFRIKRRLWKELDDEAKETTQPMQCPQEYQGYN